MIDEIDFPTWEDLEAHVRAFIDEDNKLRILDVGGHYSSLLFRGQASDNWELATTLERARPKSTLLADYYRQVAVAKSQIETFTDRQWDELDYPDIARQLEDVDGLLFSRLPAYPFLVYLRHHGFPSPLLDWSRSFYVAAYFALNSVVGARAAIYVFQEYVGSGKAGSSYQPQIVSMGPNVRSHRRHYVQQGEYTIACKYSDGRWHLVKHADVFGIGRHEQDRLWKFTVPASESEKVMKRLDEYNINAFSLFQSEESLMATLASRTYKQG